SSTLSGGFRIHQKGLDRFEVITPFTFDDGDTLPVVLKKREGGSWEISDEGRTFMYLSYYDIDMSNETRKRVLSKILSSHFMEGGDEGVLRMSQVAENDLTNAVYTFTQGLIKASDFTLWRREVSRSLFMDEFKLLVKEIGEAYPVEMDYHDTEKDPARTYPIDCSLLLKNDRRVNLFAVASEMKAKNSTITIMHYEQLKAPFTNCVLFEDEESLGRKTLIQLSDVADKTFSSLLVAKERLPIFLKKNE
ncbi:MAG: DUF1828 domain-containing protein, partial [Clostridia bacterium]|nr:DUF1828 domain-containing protein [Clostridia bacterium]